MADHISKDRRSWNMSLIRAQNTKPEKIVRSILHRMGLRFRLHGKVSKKSYPTGILPGKPDIILPRYRTVIFVNGCFWHQHEGCKRANIPKTNKKYWISKLEKNKARDKKNHKILESLGWNVIVIWECEVKKNDFCEKLQRIIHEKIYGRQFICGDRGN